MNKLYALCLSFLAFSVLLFLNTPQTLAANCYPLNNGGVTKQQYCFNPTPTPINTAIGGNSAQPQTPAPQQTKGGQRIYPTSKSKTTPNTGPADWSLPSLVILAGAGLWLRNKTKQSLKI